MNTELIKLKELLSDKKWRITSWKLYKIKDKNGNIVPFELNSAQRYFLENKHTKNIILKARQLWFSTLIDIMVLDDALFSSYHTNGIIAQDADKAKDLYDNKVKFAYDNIPKWLLEHYKPRVDRMWEIKLENNNCSVSVGTSFRSGTLQKLHISEYGKICSKYPEKAREIKTGSLNAIWPMQEVDIESTAEGASGDFYEKCQKALENEEKGKILSPMDYKFFFFPWYDEPAYTIDSDEILTTETRAYFEKIKGDEWFIRNRKGVEFAEWQMRWYQIKQEEQREDMKREYPSTPKEAFELSVEWAYYEKELGLARRQWRVWRVLYDPNIPVHTAWDLWGAGWGDETAIWFCQIYNNEVRLIDYFEGNGMSMREIISHQVANKEYRYGRHIFPHDANVTEYTTGTTRISVAREILQNVDVLERTAISDGINAVRDMFPRCWFDEEHCNVGINGLSAYKKKFIKSIGKYIDEPDHNGSNWPDAFRYLAVSIQNLHTPEPQRIQIQWRRF